MNNSDRVSNNTIGVSKEEGRLTNLAYYEDLITTQHDSVTRDADSLLDVLELQHQDSQQRLGFCNLVALLPLLPNGEPQEFAYEPAFALALAAEHLNAGDGSMIREVDGLNERCNIRFTMSFIDTKFDAGIALNQVINWTSPERRASGQRLPSAFLGAFRSAVSMPTALVSGLQGYPQISGASTSAVLDDKGQYPLFARTIPSDNAIASAAVKYFRYDLNLRHVAVINVNDAFGNSYVRAMRETASEIAPDLDILQIPLDNNDEIGIPDAISTLKQSNYQFVFAIVLSVETHDKLMTEAVNQGVAGTGHHNWIFSDLFLSVLKDRVLEVGSPLQKAYSGVGMFAASGMSGDKVDEFIETMKELKNPTDAAYLNSVVPGLGATGYFGKHSFLNPVEFDYTLYFYEAAILTGLAACAAAGESERFSLTGDELYRHIVNYPDFEGLTGTVRLHNDTGSRVADSTFFKVTNFVPEVYVDPGTRKRMAIYKQTKTSQFHEGNWTHFARYIYNDGTPNLPLGIPSPDLNENFVDTAVRAVTYSLFGVSVLLSVAFAAWTWRNRTTRVVKASQPFFLYLLCIGCAVLAVSIVPMAIDHSIASLNGCAMACNSIIWLLALGFSLIFSSLFSKTHRINKIMNNAKKFKRIQVTVRDTLKPVIVLLALNIAILSLMSAFDPITYTIRIVAEDEFGQPLETYGHCDWLVASEYLIPLFALNGLILIMAAYEAWRARNLSTEFAESTYIFRALISILLVVFVGLPVLVISADNPDASAFVSSAIVFVASCSILCLIFVPKIQYEKQRKLQQSRRNLVKISGLDYGGSTTPMPASTQFNLSGNSTHSTESAANEDEEEGVGERILTTKTAHELAEENAWLRRMLEREQERRAAYMKNVEAPAETVPLANNRHVSFEEGDKDQDQPEDRGDTTGTSIAMDENPSEEDSSDDESAQFQMGTDDDIKEESANEKEEK